MGTGEVPRSAGEVPRSAGEVLTGGGEVPEGVGEVPTGVGEEATHTSQGTRCAAQGGPGPTEWARDAGGVAAGRSPLPVATGALAGRAADVAMGASEASRRRTEVVECGTQVPRGGAETVEGPTGLGGLRGGEGRGVWRGPGRRGQGGEP